MKLALIDRDGVINEEIGEHVKSRDQLRIMPQALEAMALLNQQGFTTVIITNQSVVGRGLITLSTLNEIHAHLIKKVEESGGKIADIFFCTDHPDQATNRRKPGPGMLIEALEKYGTTPEKTPFIGDTLTDMEAAYTAGCLRYLVMTGHGQKASQNIPQHLLPVTICTDILDAAQKIVHI